MIFRQACVFIQDQQYSAAKPVNLSCCVRNALQIAISCFLRGHYTTIVKLQSPTRLLNLPFIHQSIFTLAFEGALGRAEPCVHFARPASMFFLEMINNSSTSLSLPLKVDTQTSSSSLKPTQLLPLLEPESQRLAVNYCNECPHTYEQTVLIIHSFFLHNQVKDQISCTNPLAILPPV